MKENTMAARPAKQLSAREKRRYEDLKRAREEQYKHALSRLSPLLLSVFLLSILLLALFFCDLSYIHNTDVGREVSVSVWSYALATVSGSFSSLPPCSATSPSPSTTMRRRAPSSRAFYRSSSSSRRLRSPSFPPSSFSGGSTTFCPFFSLRRASPCCCSSGPHLLARPQRLSDPARLLQRQPRLLHPLGRILPAHRGASRT